MTYNTIKKPYSCSKKLYQFITNLFFLANTPTPKYNTTYIKISHPIAWSTGVTDEISNLTILHSHGGTHLQNMKNNFVVSCTYRQNKHTFASICFLRLKIKQQDLMI